MSPWLSDLLLRTQTDERLASLASLGHQRAFETIVERYRLPLAAYAQRINQARAEDLVQQTFLAALSALQSGTEVRHLRGWLYEIVRNLAWRETGAWPALANIDDFAPATESAATVAERRMLALDALTEVAQLPERQHDALVQTAIHGRSRVEVAAAMGVSEGSVRQLVHRARATLRSAATAITPYPLVRWLAGAASAPGAGMSEATIGAGTAASGAGIALKLGVGALLAGGAVATGVISTGALNHRKDNELSSHAARVVQVGTPSGTSDGRSHTTGANATAILTAQHVPAARIATRTSAPASTSRTGSTGHGSATSSGTSGGRFGRTGSGSAPGSPRGSRTGSGSGGGNNGHGPGSGPTNSGGGGGSDDGSSGSQSSGSAGGGGGGSDDGSSGSQSSGSGGGGGGGSNSGSSGSQSSGSGGGGGGGSDDGSSGSGMSSSSGGPSSGGGGGTGSMASGGGGSDDGSSGGNNSGSTPGGSGTTGSTTPGGGSGSSSGSGQD